MFRKGCLGKRPRGLVSFVIITAILFILIEGFMYAERKLRPMLLIMAEIKATGIATEAINRAVLDQVAYGVKYKELIEVEQGDQGESVLARLNSGEVNRLMAETYLAIKDVLSNMSKESFDIPLGVIFDNYLLATYGPSIPIKFVSTGRINTELIDRFENAGINQTRHKIYLKVFTETQVIIPFTALPIKVETTIPITDTIYMGRVPSTVINLPYPRQEFSDPG